MILAGLRVSPLFISDSLRRLALVSGSFAKESFYPEMIKAQAQLRSKIEEDMKDTPMSVVAKSPLPRLLALARARGWRTLPLLSTHGNSYDHDYFGDSSALPAAVLQQQKFKAGEEWDMPMLNVFQRRGKVISHFWGSEMLYVPPEPGQEYRHNDALDSLWNMLDLTPAGRGDFHPQLSYPAINSKATRHRQRV